MARGCQLRRRNSFRPWNRPQSMRTRWSPTVSRYFEPVTVRAAPRNCRWSPFPLACGVGWGLLKSHRPSAVGMRYHAGMVATLPDDLDRALLDFFALGLSAP